VHSRHLCFWHYQWRQLQFQVDELRGQFGKVNKEVAMKKKAKEDADELIAKAKEIDTQIKAKEVECDEVAKKRDELIKVMHECVVQRLGVRLRGGMSSFPCDACTCAHCIPSYKYAHICTHTYK
jgi:seryl-tRNA synthetase